MHKHWTETRSGKRFDLKFPSPKDVDINDIACGLSKTTRFNGQTKGFLSVGMHSLNTEEWLAEQGEGYRIRLAGLMHDASEAYIHDISSPLKDLLSNYRTIERRVTRAILKGLDLEQILCLTKTEQNRVKEADQVMLVTERRDFKAKTNRQYHKKFCGDIKPWAKKLRSSSWWHVEQLFLEQYQHLRGKL